MLSEYFEEKYLNNVIKWINEYSFKYRQTYTKCYDILKPYADKAIEAIALDGIGKAGRKVGETIGKLPFADKISIDEGLVSLGNKIDAFGERKASETMKAFAEMRDPNVTGFVDQIKTLDEMHNKPVEVLYYDKVQGLELDYAIVCWDADLRRDEGNNNWDYYNFIGTEWKKRRKAEQKRYLVNSYRVLLTRARQGMVIFVPNGVDSEEDATRNHEYYDGIYNYLVSCGIKVLSID